MIFEVGRENFRETRSVDSLAPSAAALADNEVRLTIERFALTTNNITYAVAGDMLGYWGFFPTTAGWGRIPAMGLASVTESNHPDIDLGGRYFGFYPMAADVVITAQGSTGAFRDAGAHRANHAAVYTGFRDVGSDETFRADKVDEYLLLWGMFMTSFLVDDYLADSDFHGAEQTLITSASSKTSISLASCLARREGHRCVGITSERNRDFVSGLGLYDLVITYDEVRQLDASIASGLVDMAGNGAVRAAVHNHFTDALKTSLTVGATHWEEPGGQATMAGPTPEFFFAPGQSAKRTEQWGAATLAERIATAFNSLLDDTDAWLTVHHHHGPDGIETAYRSLLEGQADPATGLICSMPTSTD